jgi:alcohol dehydrogenase
MHKEERYELRKFVAPEFVFGVGALSLVGRYAKNLGGSNVLLVSDDGVMKAGWTEKVIRALGEEGIAYSVFSSLTPNPKASEIMAGALAYQENDCNIIISVGGGSVIDCAKGVGIVSNNHKNILEFEGVDRIPVPGPPLICIPTTAGSSADVSQFAIITNEEEKVKISIISKALVPDVALIDPVTTLTMPQELTAYTGIDAFTHGVEAYVSNASSPITDMFALEAIRLTSSNLPSTMADQDNMELRTNMMLGSLCAGLAFSNASLGAAHAMAHSLGGFLDLPHGESDAILLRGVIEFNYNAAVDRYERIGEAMGLNLKGMSGTDKRSTVIEAIINLERRSGINKTLGQIGVRKKDIPVLAKKAMKDVCIVTNPRQISQKDIEDIYEGAL